MPSPARPFSNAAAALLLAGAAAALSVAAFAWRDAASAPPAGASAGTVSEPPAAPEPDPRAADPLAGLAAVLAPPPVPAAGALARRYRLAGTIHGGFEGGVSEPMAVFDDRVEMRSFVLTRGEEAEPGVVLVAVGDGSATLAGPDGEETLVLEHRLVPPAAASAGAADAAAGPAETPAAPRTREEAAARFGGRETFPGRWTYDRAKVKDYYDELMSEPTLGRALGVFDSMEPVWVEDLDGERRIDGYRLRVQAEPELFLAAGLQEGDVVKSVNSMLMTNRRRAEDMIAAFATGAGTMFVLEIERDGKTFKQLYEFEDDPATEPATP